MLSIIDNIFFILVEPQLGENIGAAARVMDNFGFSQLRIVNPRALSINDKAKATAAHALHVLENAVIYDSLEQAISDLNFVIATSAKTRALPMEQINIMELRPYVESCNSQSNANIGILFGRERIGLLNEELAYADRLIYIPTNSSNPSLNLSHAVAVVAYELCRKQYPPSLNKNMNSFTKKQLAAFALRLLEDLESFGFFTVPEKKDYMKLKVQNLLTKMIYDEQELKLLMGMFNAFKKRDRI